MSGGHFDYRNDSLCYDIFGYGLSPDYGEHGYIQAKQARRLNPMEDAVISELVFDVFCLLHSFDWYQSGDTGEETYRADVRHFKEKWLKPLPESRVKEIIDDELYVLRDKLYRSFNINGGDNPCTTST